MSIKIVVGMSDAVGTCRDKLCRIEDKLRLLSVLVRAIPHDSEGTEVEALRHDLTTFVPPPGWVGKRGETEASDHAEAMAIVLFERPLYLPDWCAAREPDFVDGLLSVRAALAAEGVIAELDQ